MNPDDIAQYYTTPRQYHFIYCHSIGWEVTWGDWLLAHNDVGHVVIIMSPYPSLVLSTFYKNVYNIVVYTKSAMRYILDINVGKLKKHFYY